MAHAEKNPGKKTFSGGQGIMLDFMFGFMIFIVAWAYISGQYDLKLSEIQKADSIGKMKIKAERVADTLVKTKGSPENWEKLGIWSLQYPGLALNDREISEAKLAAFTNMTSDYLLLKEKMGLEGFDFSFNFKGSIDVNAGLAPQGNATQIVVQRVAVYKGGPGIATLRVYRLEG